MTKEKYIKMTRPFRENLGLARGLHIANKLCTGIMYVSYPLLLIYLFRTKNEGLFRAFFVPAVSFVLLSVFRHVVNRPRPYETFGVPPVIPKDTKGKSFPSRHVFSAALIAMTFLLMSPWIWLGGVFLCVVFMLAVVRVVSGVHYISDVIAGIVAAVAATVIGYVIL